MNFLPIYGIQYNITVILIYKKHSIIFRFIMNIVKMQRRSQDLCLRRIILRNKNMLIEFTKDILGHKKEAPEGTSPIMVS